MNSGFTPKSLALLFVAVLVLYLAGFYGCEHVRHRQGAWEVEFQTDPAGTPAVTINQPKLGISSVRIVFAGERAAGTNLPQKVAFDVPGKRVPFGRVVFEDLTFLPGVVALDFFGHEVQMMPRVLTVNRAEVPWQSSGVITLAATNKPAVPFPPPAKYRRR